MTTTNPYSIEGPALISFSGGRTSAYMLKHILDAHGGELPPAVHAVFMNTGKEMPETLDFIQECSDRWNVPITWLEYDPDEEGKTKVVNHNSASRSGEPFEALIEKKSFLPNPVMRFCTQELKIKRGEAFMSRYEEWTCVIGLRRDEPRRVARMKDRTNYEFPLYHANVTSTDIRDYWAASDFDLDLMITPQGQTPHSNCNLCFLKGKALIQGIQRDMGPEVSEWWVRMEEKIGGTFRSDRPSYKEMAASAENQGDLFSGDGSIDCFCTD